MVNPNRDASSSIVVRYSWSTLIDIREFFIGRTLSDFCLINVLPESDVSGFVPVCRGVARSNC